MSYPADIPPSQASLHRGHPPFALERPGYSSLIDNNLTHVSSPRSSIQTGTSSNIDSSSTQIDSRSDEGTLRSCFNDATGGNTILCFS